MNVPPGEKLTHFIRYSNHFSIETNRVKHYAFLPHKNSVNAICVSHIRAL